MNSSESEAGGHSINSSDHRKAFDHISNYGFCFTMIYRNSARILVGSKAKSLLKFGPVAVLRRICH